MRLTIDHRVTITVVNGEDNKVLKLLQELKILNIENMAKTKQEFKDLKAGLQDSLNNIAADIERLVSQGQRSDLTEAEEEEIFTDFSDIATQLRAIADKTPEGPEVPPIEQTNAGPGLPTG